LKVLGFLRVLPRRRDWVYLLSLLVPFVLYNLALKAYSVAAQPNVGLDEGLELMRSDIFFNLGYVLLWVGLFAAARRGPLRRVVVVLFHAVTVLVVLVNTCAHAYFRETGTTLDYGTVAEWIPKFDEIKPILLNDVPALAWILLFIALFYATLGPLIVTRLLELRRGGQEKRTVTRTAGTSFLSPLGLWLLALGFGALSLITGTTSLARDPVTNMILTGVAQATAEDYAQAAPAAANPAANARLVQTPETEKRNVVLIHLESTRAQSVTPYNEDLETMPFLDELSKNSLLVDRAYTTVPRSSKASVGVNCGVEPPLYPGPEFEPGGVPARCLANLLKEQSYRTVFFASTDNTMDNFGDVAAGFGYEEIYSSETMDREGFQVTNTFGFEEDIMLDPSERWLEENKDEPFLAEYFTGTGHYGYECVPNRYGYQNFSENEELDRYHNCMLMLDHFLENLFDQYKRLGLYEDTTFVIFGDHGEGFNEHGRSMHGDTIYEEGLRVPLIIHDPKRFQDGERVEGLSSQIDILPTVVEMLGYEVEDGEYPGYSLLREPPEDRTLRFSCISERKCLASTTGYEKYIYHYDNEPDQLFDLSEDPLEQNNLADELSREEIDRRREDLLRWYAEVNAEYGGR
jgi:phosphoglycerol transferase MdoB-like AlkP superfamily enzyme